MRREYRFLETRTEDLGDRPIAYVDTTGADHAHAGRWIQLSHWYPNETPPEYRADTSTEIALRFAIKNPDHDYLPVNDHADTDGVLSLFALAHPELAAEHFDAVVGAAEVGDFGFWSTDGARRLYAALSEVRATEYPSQSARVDACLDRVEATLDGTLPLTPAGRDIEAVFAASADLVDASERVELAPRLAAYRLADDRQLAAIDATPRFDEHPKLAWISHRARNRVDRERLQLVSVPSRGGWHHSLWYPQYLPWDTETLWRLPGLEFTGANLTWRCVDEALLGAVEALAGTDAAGRWAVADAVAPFAPGFPVLVEGRDSALSPDRVGAKFAEVLPS